MDIVKFERLVTQALDELPEEFRERMENIDIIIEDRPSREQLRRLGTRRGEMLLGLYEGVPLTDRTRGYSFVAPDKISIFRRPIEAACTGDAQIVKEVRRVVLHEIAHHFGIDDERLKELGM